MTNKHSVNDPIFHPLKIQHHVFPGVWRYMMPQEFLQLSFPEERRATCMDCPKAIFSGYRPDYRCCTYFPRIPNFLLGLATHTRSGAHRVTSIITAGYATPEGMNSTPQQWIDYLEDLEHDRFGRSETVLCPMLDRDNGYCQVHAFRNSVCSTFFCHKDHGSKGDDFWTKVQTLGSQIEMSLAQWAMEQLEFDVKSYIKRVNSLAKKIKLVSDPETGGWSEEARSYIWGSWFGRELEFFEACGELIRNYRDQLWDIANQSDIREASKFDRAMVKMVPKSLNDQLDPADLEEGGDTILPQELWKDCRKSHQKIWKLPVRNYILSRKVKIMANELDDQVAQKFSDYPYVICFLSKGKVEDRVFINQNKHDVLKKFASSQSIGWKFLTDVFGDDYLDGKKFISEMIAQKVIIPEKGS